MTTPTISFIILLFLFIMKHGRQIVAITDLYFQNKISAQRSKREALAFQKELDNYNEGKAEKLVVELKLMSDYIDYLHTYCKDGFMSYTQWSAQRLRSPSRPA